MSHLHTALRLVGAEVLTPEGLGEATLSVDQGVLGNRLLPELDLSGYWVLPGIIDLHGDAFERHMAPRPTAPFPMRTGLVATDRDAAANGVTTAWMAQSWSWEGGARAPAYAEDLLAAHAAYKPCMNTDLRIQIRCETHTVDSEAHLLAVIEQFGVDYVIFNNHLDEALEAAAHNPQMIIAWAAKAGRTPHEHIELVRQAKARDREVPRYLCNLANAFDRLGVRYGSHDDSDGATRERFSMIGAKICEFPTSMGAAVVARTWNEPILMGAPNVVRGGSQSGNVSAALLIENAACDALVSDYYYPALPDAAFTLTEMGLKTFAEAWAMISAAPARIMGLDDRGDLSAGKRADLVIINKESRIVEATMSAGRWTHLCGEVASRVSALGGPVRVAAE